MSDLKERIGRKVGYNKSWIRPGYQVKTSAPKQSQTKKQIPTATGHESGQSSHEEDSRRSDRHPSHLGFRISPRPTGAVSLLERMGLSPSIDSGDEDIVDTEDVAKSLIERVGPVASAEAVFDSRAQTPDDVDPCGKGQGSVNARMGTLITETLDVQPPATDSSNTGTAVAQITKAPANSDKDKNDEAMSPQVHHAFQGHSLDGEHLKDKIISGPSKQGHAVTSSPRSSPTPDLLHPDQSVDAKLSDSHSNDIDMLNTCSSGDTTPLPSSSIEDGEVRDLETVVKVRELLVPLVLQNASGRMSAVQHARPQPTSLDMDILTDKVCSSFQERVEDLRESMNSSSIESRTNIPLVEAHHPIASTVQIATGSEEPSRHSVPMTYEGDRTTLRYTPSPQRQHWSRSSIKNKSLQPDFLRNSQRFVSPSRYPGRHRSPSAERRYRLPPNAHEYHSPEPPSTRPRPPRGLHSPASASRSHFFPDKKYRRSPHSRSRSPYESARQARGGYRGRGSWDDYATRRSASPRLRRPYESYSNNRGPRRRSRSSDSQISDQSLGSRYSPDRRPRAKRILDHDFSPRTMPISEPLRNTQEGLSEDVKTTGTTKPFSNAEADEIGETATFEQKHNLPCHHVPGLWFVKVALNDIGTLECSFEIDSETAIKWKINDKPNTDITDDSPQTPLSLQIHCIATELVEETFRSLQNNATPEDIALAIFSLKMEWPTQGHLIIAVNPQHEKDGLKQIFLPEKLGPTSSICIDDLVHEGQNVVQFIQLSNMTGKVFVLCATSKQDVKPDEVIYTSKDDGIIGIDQGVVKVSPLE